MKTEITIKNGVDNRIFTPGEMDHVSKFLINAYNLNKDEWDKQKITIVQAVRLALSMGAFQDELEKKLFKNKEK